MRARLLALATLVGSPAHAQPAAEDEVMVVTGTRTEGRLTDTPVATEVVDRAAIEASGARTLGELLGPYAGVTLGSSFRGTALGLGGLSPEHTLVLIDGERPLGRVDGVFDLERLRVEHIERVEVVRGSGSALYGADAIGGVVNVVTRRARGEASAEATAGVASDGAKDVGGAVRTPPLGPLRLRLSGGWHAAPPFDLDVADDATTGSGVDDVQVAGRALWDAGRALRVTLDADVARRRRDGVDASGAGALLDRAQLDEALGVSLRGEGRPAPGLRLRGSVAYGLQRQQLRIDQRGGEALDVAEDAALDQAQTNAQVDVTLPAGHLLSVGVDGLHESVDRDRLDAGGADRQRGAVYVQDQWTLLPDPYLVVVAGGRVDADTDFGAEATPRVAVRYDPHPAVALRVSAGGGYRAPTFEELYLRFDNPSVGYRVEGDRDLQPERALSVRGGVHWRPDGAFDLRVEGFRNDVEGLIVIERVAREADGADRLDRYRYANVAEAVTQGVEVEAATHVMGALDLRAGYTLLDARDLAADRALEGRPTHAAHAELGARLAALATQATVRGQVSGPRPFYDEDDLQEEAPTLGTLEARLAWTPVDALTVFVRGENLLDAGDPTYAPLRPRRFGVGLIGRL
ncbi:MAG: TonB-dependent receptor [Myxococcales bacterium]|nr:TonB-dependent receptor [Myxococcales bacterium]